MPFQAGTEFSNYDFVIKKKLAFSLLKIIEFLL